MVAEKCIRSRKSIYKRDRILILSIRQQNHQKSLSTALIGAGDGIRTHEHLRDWTLNPAPLTWLGNPRKRGSNPHALVLFNSIRKAVLL